MDVSNESEICIKQSDEYKLEVQQIANSFLLFFYWK